MKRWLCEISCNLAMLLFFFFVGFIDEGSCGDNAAASATFFPCFFVLFLHVQFCPLSVPYLRVLYFYSKWIIDSPLCMIMVLEVVRLLQLIPYFPATAIGIVIKVPEHLLWRFESGELFLWGWNTILLCKEWNDFFNGG